MKKLLAAMFVALLMVGCGEEAQKKSVQEEAKDDPSVPLLIPCKACKKEVSKSGEVCANCSHPIPDSVEAYVEAEELARMRAERLARRRDEEKRRRDEESAKALGIGLDDYKNFAGAIDKDKLEWRDEEGEEGEGPVYAKDQQTPYTGWVKRMRVYNGQIRWLRQYKDGKFDGPWIEWHSNGQKGGEVNYKDGKRDGLRIEWHKNGQKKFECTYKDDKRDGLWTNWYYNGQKKSEDNSKNGKLITLVGWKPNGEKCPETKIDKDGNGVWVRYYDDGTEFARWTFKDGESVGDDANGTSTPTAPPP